MTSPHVRDATDDDFDQVVLARSGEVPVLVDFWAAWCGPCRVLGPVLEQLAGENVGRVEVVKVDTDANPIVAARYGIRSIPAVKLFVDGKAAAEFVGALPAAQVRKFLDTHVPRAADKAANAAQAALDAGELDRAETLAAEARAADPKPPRASLVAAHVALRRGRPDDAAALAREVPPMAAEYDTAQAMVALIDVIRAAGGAAPDVTAAALAAAPDDLAARFRHAAALAGAGRHRDALDELLVIVERDRRWNDEAARKAMLAIFATLGVRAPISDEYRKRLALLL